VQAQKSAVKAMLMNKIGDLFLLFAIAIMTFYTRGDMSFYATHEPSYNKAIIEGQW
jgi:NADH:ubiquinone oxidoreductase subunit 5 (subunit L)/multisubunit Na+/H+ antiporter MnhA subunit